MCEVVDIISMLRKVSEAALPISAKKNVFYHYHHRFKYSSLLLKKSSWALKIQFWGLPKDEKWMISTAGWILLRKTASRCLRIIWTSTSWPGSLNKEYILRILNFEPYISEHWTLTLSVLQNDLSNFLTIRSTRVRLL